MNFANSKFKREATTTPKCINWKLMWKRLKEKRVQQQQQRKQHQENDRKNSLLENCHQEFAFCMQNKFW